MARNRTAIAEFLFSIDKYLIESKREEEKERKLSRNSHHIHIRSILSHSICQVK